MKIMKQEAIAKREYYPWVLSAMFLVLTLVLPLLTGQIPEIGNMLCPMHLPVLLCGFFCGPWYALGVGFIAPIVRFIIFGAPMLMPRGIAMCVELAAYGFTAGLLYRLLPKKKIYIYVALIIAMIAGRVVWGIARVLLYGLGEYDFSFALFISSGFLNAIPGIILQLVLIPILVMTLSAYGYTGERGKAKKTALDEKNVADDEANFS